MAKLDRKTRSCSCCGSNPTTTNPATEDESANSELDEAGKSAAVKVPKKQHVVSPEDDEFVKAFDSLLTENIAVNSRSLSRSIYLSNKNTNK